ncbi:MAG: UbiA family prenyltransferase, partial [Candidatus Obscuribacterales bacterium]|nr:UbiA family prenyltransferase [Candidatus Obscuribacterales bacterium]
MEFIQTPVQTIEISPFKRFDIYQRERFPLKKYAPLVAAFSFSGLALSYLVTGGTAAISFHMFAVAFIVILALFAQLRICDEFKDKDIDALYHPSRPVQRGLVRLESLKNAGIILLVIQILLVLSLDAMLLGPLFLAYAYLYLMTREFFVRKWLRAHAAIYMISHMFILFFTDLFITSCHWMVSELTPPPALLYFFGLSFMLAMIIEIGRKIRASQDEMPGVETYSLIWGAKQAIAVWLISATIAAG